MWQFTDARRTVYAYGARRVDSCYWRRMGPHPDAPDFAVLGVVIGGPILLIVMLVYILLPASIGILISEAFAIRSWIFHVLNGVVSAWLGWQFYGGDAGTGMPIDQPWL